MYYIEDVGWFWGVIFVASLLLQMAAGAPNPGYGHDPDLSQQTPIELRSLDGNGTNH